MRRIDCHILLDPARQEAGLRMLSQLSREPVNIIAREAQPGALTQARIDAMRCGRAEYVCWVDDDDEITPGIFSRLLAELDRRPDACGVFSSEAHVKEGRVIAVRPNPGEAWSLRDMILRHPLVHHIAIFRRSLAQPYFDTIRPFPLVGDQLLLWLVARHGPWVHVPIVGYHWRRDGQQLTQRPGIGDEFERMRQYFFNTFLGTEP